MGNTQDFVRVDAAEAEAFGQRLLTHHGLAPEHAAIVAHCLVRADLRGIDTHGLQFLPQYLARVRRGLINPRPVLSPRRVTPVAATLDGDNGFGFVVGMRAITEAMDMARSMGIGIVSAHRSTHFGMAAAYVLPALEAGLIAMVFSTATRAVQPGGGRRGRVGARPMAGGRSQ